MVSLRNLLRNLPSFCRVSDGKSDMLLALGRREATGERRETR
jgi:hypothetical protein